MHYFNSVELFVFVRPCTQNTLSQNNKWAKRTHGFALQNVLGVLRLRVCPLPQGFPPEESWPLILFSRTANK